MTAQSTSDLKRYRTEGAFSDVVYKYLDSQEDVRYYISSDRYRRGVADVIANVGGTMALLELKADKGKPSPHQQKFIKDLTSVGGCGGVCYCLRDVKNILEEARNG